MNADAGGRCFCIAEKANIVGKAFVCASFCRGLI